MDILKNHQTTENSLEKYAKNLTKMIGKNQLHLVIGWNYEVCYVIQTFAVFLEKNLIKTDNFWIDKILMSKYKPRVVRLKLTQKCQTNLRSLPLKFAEFISGAKDEKRLCANIWFIDNFEYILWFIHPVPRNIRKQTLNKFVIYIGLLINIKSLC